MLKPKHERRAALEARRGQTLTLDQIEHLTGVNARTILHWGVNRPGRYEVMEWDVEPQSVGTDELTTRTIVVDDALIQNVLRTYNINRAARGNGHKAETESARVRLLRLLDNLEANVQHIRDIVEHDLEDDMRDEIKAKMLEALQA